MSCNIHTQDILLFTIFIYYVLYFTSWTFVSSFIGFFLFLCGHMRFWWSTKKLFNRKIKTEKRRRRRTFCFYHLISKRSRHRRSDTIHDIIFLNWVLTFLTRVHIHTLIGQLDKSFYFSSAAKLAIYDKKRKEIDDNQLSLYTFGHLLNGKPENIDEVISKWEMIFDI